MVDLTVSTHAPTNSYDASTTNPMARHGADVHGAAVVGVADYVAYGTLAGAGRCPYAAGEIVVRVANAPFERSGSARADMQAVLVALLGVRAPAVLAVRPSSRGSCVEYVCAAAVGGGGEVLRAFARNAVLMDRRGFHVARGPAAAAAMEAYCETVRKLPQRRRHWLTDGLPCLPLSIRVLDAKTGGDGRQVPTGSKPPARATQRAATATAATTPNSHIPPRNSLPSEVDHHRPSAMAPMVEGSAPCLYPCSHDRGDSGPSPLPELTLTLPFSSTAAPSRLAQHRMHGGVRVAVTAGPSQQTAPQTVPRPSFMTPNIPSFAPALAAPSLDALHQRYSQQSPNRSKSGHLEQQQQGVHTIFG